MGAVPAFGPVAVVAEDPLAAARCRANVHRCWASHIHNLDEAFVGPGRQSHGLVLEEEFQPGVPIGPSSDRAAPGPSQ